MPEAGKFNAGQKRLFMVLLVGMLVLLARDGVQPLGSMGTDTPLAVLSNKPDVFTKRMVAHYFPANPFAAVAGHQAGTALKPDPAGALAIARQLAIPAAEWLYLGDTNTDMQTARAAGMRAVGVLWGFRERAELVGSGAMEIVAAPAEVLGLLERA